MLTERQLAELLAFSQQVQLAQAQCDEASRALSRLYTPAIGLDTLLSGPAEDVRARIGDADGLVADAVGKLREVQMGLTAVLNAQALPEKVAELGWHFDGWVPAEGWVAWRQWEANGPRETLTHRNAAELLHKLRHRNEQEVGHA